MCHMPTTGPRRRLAVAVGAFNLPKLFLEHLQGLKETPGGSLPTPHCGRSDIYCTYITNNHRKGF